MFASEVYTTSAEGSHINGPIEFSVTWQDVGIRDVVFEDVRVLRARAPVTMHS